MPVGSVKASLEYQMPVAGCKCQVAGVNASCECQMTVANVNASVN